MSEPTKRSAESKQRADFADAADDILTDYMDQLLLRTLVTDDVSEGTLVVDGEIQGWEPEAAEESETVTETEPETVVVEDITAGEAATVDTTAEPAITSGIQPDGDISPVFDDIQSEAQFDCLIIRAGEYRLGIPMKSLGTIHTSDKKPTPLPGQASWILGSWPFEGRTMQVMDCLKLLMPEREHAMSANEASFFLQLTDSPWLLACDEVFEPVTTQHSDVRWRANRSDRPWMAGIHKSEMCVVLDVGGLLSLLGPAPAE